MYSIVLKRNKEKKILKGYPWVYANEVSRVEGKDKNGSVARVVSFDGRFVAYGFVNHLSKILVRVLSLDERDGEGGDAFGYEFFKKRIMTANARRISMGYGDNYRIVFGESDRLPGLIADRYNDIVCIQFLCLGVDQRREMFTSIFAEIFKPRGIYERSDVAVRKKEGLDERKGRLYGGEFDPVATIRENGLTLFVDVENGQKTGYYLDQKDNRRAVAEYCKGMTVLDCFCNVGGFSLCAAKAGAKSVTAVDVSETALESVRKNAEANGLCVNTARADVFEYLRELRRSGKTFGVVILDPPAFTKSADTVKDAIRGYKDINAQGLRLVESGGFLVSCSCSRYLTPTLFSNMISDSVFESGRQARLIEMRYQGRDHATRIGSDEGLYLKVAVLQVE